MSKRKSTKTQDNHIYYAIAALQEAFDRLEGSYSNIPDCCVEGFINGRTYMNVKNSLPEKDQKKLDKWNYVPCDSCFKGGKISELKLNGTSDLGEVIYKIIEILRNKEKGDEGKSNKRSKK